MSEESLSPTGETIALDSNKPTRIGVLEKKGHVWNHTLWKIWKRRWFSLVDQSLNYYSSEENMDKGRVKRVLYVNRFSVIEAGVSRKISDVKILPGSRNIPFEYCFLVKGLSMELNRLGKIDLELAAETIDQKYAWIGDLQATIFQDIPGHLTRRYHLLELLSEIEISVLFPIEIIFRIQPLPSTTFKFFSKDTVSIPDIQKDEGFSVPPSTKLHNENPRICIDSSKFSLKDSLIIDQNQLYTIILINLDYKVEAPTGGVNGSAKSGGQQGGGANVGYYIQWMSHNATLLDDQSFSTLDICLEFSLQGINPSSRSLMLIFNQAAIDLNQALGPNNRFVRDRNLSQLQQFLGLGPLVGINCFTFK